MTKTNTLTFNMTAFPVTSRATKTGKTQYTQRYQLDQAGQPALVFDRTSMTADKFPAPGPVLADASLYLKSVKNDAGYMRQELAIALRNVRSA